MDVNKLQDKDSLYNEGTMVFERGSQKGTIKLTTAGT